jgi:hypothetical protein
MFGLLMSLSTFSRSQIEKFDKSAMVRITDIYTIGEIKGEGAFGKVYLA